METLGLENIQEQGRAVLVGNHSGRLPIDAFMLYTATIHRILCFSLQGTSLTTKSLNLANLANYADFRVFAPRLP